LNSEPIRVLVVEADPDRVPTTLAYLAEIAGIEVVGVAHSRLVTINQLEEAQPDVLLVDLMLTGYRSIEIVRHVSNTHPQVRVLALAPADPPHDRDHPGHPGRRPRVRL
jgi:two-component system invasion response regulator UvrY